MVSIKTNHMSETANNIYSESKKEKSLSDVGDDLLSKGQSTWLQHKISVGVVAIVFLAAGWLKLIMTVDSVYLNALTPALIIVGMVMLLRLFERPISK